VKTERLTELLSSTPFGTLDAAVTAGLLRLFVARRIERGTIVFLEGDAGSGFFLVAEGRLKAYRSTPPNHEITVFTLTEGDFFGLLPLLDGGPYPVSVAALSDAEVLVLHRHDFLRFVRDNPSFSVALLALLSHRLRDCLGQVEMLGRQGALARVAHSLLSLAGPAAAAGAGVEATLPFTQAEFAQLLHVTPENLSRALAKLRRDGLVERLGPRRFRVPDLSALRRAADGD